MRKLWVHDQTITVPSLESEPICGMHRNPYLGTLSKGWCLSTLSMSKYEDRFAREAIDAVTYNGFCSSERENWEFISEHP